MLIYARATGAVDNTACRDFSGLDTLTASRVLRRLRDRGLLEKQGAGRRTHYTLRAPVPIPPPPANPSMDAGREGGKASMPEIEACNPDMEGLACASSGSPHPKALPGTPGRKSCMKPGINGKPMAGPFGSRWMRWWKPWIALSIRLNFYRWIEHIGDDHG